MFEGRVQRMFDLVERKDLASIMAGWADDGVMELPGHASVSGRYEGKAAIEAFFSRWFERMATIRPSVKRVGFANPVRLTYGNTMYVESEIEQQTREGEHFRTDVVGVYRFRRGKLGFYREFLFDPAVWDGVWGTQRQAPED